MCVGGTTGETFRQKDRKTYHILNLVLYGKCDFTDHFDRAKDRKGVFNTRVFKRPFSITGIVTSVIEKASAGCGCIFFLTSEEGLMLEERSSDSMNRGKYILVTNNPMVYEKHRSTHHVMYREISYEGLLREVRDRIHEGHRLLTHPLSGSVKPNETPYKSILISEERGDVDQSSVSLIENAILACSKFEFRSDRYQPEVYEDFQLIDCTLIESGMASADALG